MMVSFISSSSDFAAEECFVFRVFEQSIYSLTHTHQQKHTHTNANANERFIQREFNDKYTLICFILYIGCV